MARAGHPAAGVLPAWSRNLLFLRLSMLSRSGTPRITRTQAITPKLKPQCPAQAAAPPWRVRRDRAGISAALDRVARPTIGEPAGPARRRPSLLGRKNLRDLRGSGRGVVGVMQYFTP